MEFFFKLLDLDEAIKNEDFNLVKECITYFNENQEAQEEIKVEFFTIFLTYLDPSFINSELKLEIIKYLIDNFNLISLEDKEYFTLLFTFKFLANNSNDFIVVKNWLIENGKKLLLLNKESKFNNELSKNLQIEILLTCRVRGFFDLMQEFRNIIQ